MSAHAEVVVAGHISFDITPCLEGLVGPLADSIVPGCLINIGPAAGSTGGQVANAGLALYRLGAAVSLMGKVGDDLFGRALLDTLGKIDESLATGIGVVPGENTSYTIVISPPGVDRTFLHCPGANNTFSADDVDYDACAKARMFHFGYPPIMRKMFQNNGADLEAIFRRVKTGGTTTSLDMAYVDPSSEAGHVDWRTILKRVLPHVDFFLPSLDEVLFMADRDTFIRLQSEFGDACAGADGRLLSELSARLIDMGAAVVALKLGDRGMYLRTTSDRSRLAGVGALSADMARAWAGRELFTGCFEVKVTGTIAAGDCAVAGFLTGLLHGMGPAETLTSAAAVGACCVEAPDAANGIIPWQRVQSRIAGGWKRADVSVSLDGWRETEHTGVLASADDGKA